MIFVFDYYGDSISVLLPQFNANANLYFTKKSLVSLGFLKSQNPRGTSIYKCFSIYCFTMSSRVSDEETLYKVEFIFQLIFSFYLMPSITLFVARRMSMTVDKEQPLLSFSLQTITLFRGTF